MSDTEFSPTTVRRNQMLLGGGILTVVMILAYLWVDSNNKAVEAPPPPQPKTVNINAPGALVDDKDAWRGLADKQLSDMSKRLVEMDQRMQKNAASPPPPDASDRLTAIPDDLRKQPVREPALADVDAYNKAETHRRAELEQQNRKRGTLPPQPPPPTPPASRGATPVAPPPGRPGEDVSATATPVPVVEKSRAIKTEEIKDIAGAAQPSGGKTDTAAPSASAGGRMHVGNYIPTGSFAKISVLMGIDAPTGGQAQTNALPVFFHVTDLAFLPNGFRHDIKNCVITGSGTGDVSSHRVFVRTETLSCVRTDGTVVEVGLKGHVAGEDGKYGFRGRLVEKQGQVMTNAALAALASGIGTAFQQSSVTQSVSPLGVTNSVTPEKAIQSGVSSGVGNAMNMIARHWLSVAEKIFPVLEVDAGRVGEVVIAKGVALPDFVGGTDTGEFAELERRNKRMNRYDEL